MSFDEEKKMFKDSIWTTEHHTAVLLLFFFFLYLDLTLKKSTPLGSNSWNWLKCLLGYTSVIEKNLFKFHSRYNLFLLYRLKWKVHWEGKGDHEYLKFITNEKFVNKACPWDWGLCYITSWNQSAKRSVHHTIVPKKKNTVHASLSPWEMPTPMVFFNLLITFWHFSFKSHRLWWLTQQKNYFFSQL